MKPVYREAEGGYEVIKGGAVAGFVPSGHPMVDQILDLQDRGEVTVEPPAQKQPDMSDERAITMDDIVDALEARGVITRAQIIASRRAGR